jgi:hypothetical protein
MTARRKRSAASAAAMTGTTPSIVPPIGGVRFGHGRNQVPAVSLRALDLAVLLAVRKELPSLFEPCLVHEDRGGAGL